MLTSFTKFTVQVMIEFEIAIFRVRLGGPRTMATEASIPTVGLD